MEVQESMSRDNEPSWITIISFIVFYILGVVVAVLFKEEILRAILGVLSIIL